MYRLTEIMSNDTPLNLIFEVSFNPAGTLFAVTYGQANQVVMFDARTRSVLRVYQNPEAGLDNPHGILLTDKHMVVSNAHNGLRSSSFTIYKLNDLSHKPVSFYETPYQHLREAHSLVLHNNILVVTYSENAEGPGAVVSYQFDDEAGMISGPICRRESFFTQYGEPKGVAFRGDGSQLFVTYVTERRAPRLMNYARRLKAARQALQKNGVADFFRYIHSKSVKIFHPKWVPNPEVKNGIAIFDISDSGVLSEEPVKVLERDLYCRLENIHVVGDTALLVDTINGRVYLYDLANDPQFDAPVQTITSNLTLPHGAKLSPDLNVLVVTNFALKVSNQIIHWMTPDQNSSNSLLVFDLYKS